MAIVTYRPPDVLHWFGTGSHEALASAKRKARALAKPAQETSVKDTILKAASLAADFGRGAGAEMVNRQAAETVYKLAESEFSVRSPMSQQTIAYSAVTAIRAEGKDRFSLEHDGGTLSVRPIAHLVSGRVRVPVGWMRNDIEVPFTMLLDELSARCGLEIEPA